MHEALIFILINTIARDLIKAKTVTISSDYADSRADTKGEEGKRDQAEWWSFFCTKRLMFKAKTLKSRCRRDM